MDREEEKITLVFEVPEDVSDEEAAEAIKGVALAADELHRALGGHGLKLKDVDVSQYRDKKGK